MAIGTFSWTVVLLPAIWPLNVVSLIGIVWFLSLLNVIFRDIQNLLTPVLMVMLVISPIAYTPEIVPDSLKPLILLNPFAYFVVAYQQVITLGIYPGPLHALALVLARRGSVRCWAAGSSRPRSESSSTMSEHAIKLDGVGKMYKIFSSRTANLKDALGLPSVRKSRYSAFWAVRDIDLELAQGQRLGIIGRNGAGKSTILKLITQNVAPTEGTVTVEGQVQALLDTGGGLHPEFTGDENIEASLTFLGLGHGEIRAARDDIAEFTELGRFLEQPFKTYSTGMQARLAFGIATTIQPEILVVDEILGAGDAYFFSKSITRMQRLIESGASVLLVSHALDQIIRFCDEAIWLERGQIVMRGQAPRSSRHTRSSSGSSMIEGFARRTRRRRPGATTGSTVRRTRIS